MNVKTTAVLRRSGVDDPKPQVYTDWSTSIISIDTATKLAKVCKPCSEMLNDWAQAELYDAWYEVSFTTCIPCDIISNKM